MTLSYTRAIVPMRKGHQAPDPGNLWVFDLDADGAPRLANADGEIVEGEASEVFARIAALGRDSVVWCDPGRLDMVDYCTRPGLLDDLLARGWIVQPCVSGRRTVALRLLRSQQSKRAHMKLQSLRTWQQDAPHVRDADERLPQLVNRAWSLTLSVWQSMNVRPGLTPASTAYDAWRASLDPGRLHWRPSAVAVEDMRAAFFGGIVASRPADLQRVRQYDMRGAYAWALRQGVPIGPATYVVAEEPPDVPAFYRVRAWLSGKYPSPFMIRGERYSQDMATRLGEVETWATSEDIALARRWGGIVEVLEGWAFLDGLARPFDDFVSRVSQLERGSGIIRSGAKLLRNSLYGRFGRRRTFDQVLISADPPEHPDWMPYYGARGPVDSMWVLADVEVDSPGLMPHWAAWITAAVRRRLLSAWVDLADAGYRVFYVDTDCVITDGELPCGTEYGDWRLVHHYRAFQVYASKRYVGLTTLDEIIQAWAGIPRVEGDRDIETWRQQKTAAAVWQPP